MQLNCHTVTEVTFNRTTIRGQAIAHILKINHSTLVAKSSQYYMYKICPLTWEVQLFWLHQKTEQIKKSIGYSHLSACVCLSLRTAIQYVLAV